MLPDMHEKATFGIRAGRLFFAGDFFILGFFFLETGFVLSHKRAKFRIVVFLAVEGVIERAFRVLFRHGGYSL
jgi:hypothetical protein